VFSNCVAIKNPDPEKTGPGFVFIFLKLQYTYATVSFEWFHDVDDDVVVRSSFAAKIELIFKKPIIPHSF